MEVVGHNLFSPARRLDGGGVDLEELDGVDGPVVLLRQFWPELGGLFDPAELAGEGTIAYAVLCGVGSTLRR